MSNEFYGYGQQIATSPEDYTPISILNVHLVRIDIHRRTTKLIRIFINQERAQNIIAKYNDIYMKRGYYLIEL